MSAIAAGGVLGLAFAKSPYDQLAKAIEQLKAGYTDQPTTESRSKHCPKCGHQLALKDSFCTNCSVKC
jgi:hypothetical protein